MKTAENGIQRRFCELRYDAETRKVSGVAMPYNTVAVLPFGIKERFVAGAFGDLANHDLILNIMHRRDRPLARSGGGLDILDSETALRIEATLPTTAEGNDAIQLIQSGVYRGLSIEAAVRRTRVSGGVIEVLDARLRGVALVDRPAYKSALVDRMAAGQRRWVY